MVRRSAGHAAAALLVAAGVAAVHGQTLGVGRSISPSELPAGSATILPDGRGLPSGAGTASEGRGVYEVRCASCHGANGAGGPFDPLTGRRGTLTSPRALKTVGSFWPYATTLWDYINRTMPYDRPGSLTSDEVYAVTAYVLHLNGIVQEGERLTDSSLPQVRMPNRDGFVR